MESTAVAKPKQTVKVWFSQKKTTIAERVPVRRKQQRLNKHKRDARYKKRQYVYVLIHFFRISKNYQLSGHFQTFWARSAQ